MSVGLNEGGWETAGAQDVARGFQVDRLDVADGESASDTSVGVKVDMLFSGPYNSGGVSALGASSWAQNAVSMFQSQCGGSASNCPAVEVLNEPYGSWFWGSSADSQANAVAYGNLVKATYQAFHAPYGSNSPLILAATFANGCGNGSAVGCADPWWNWLVAGVPDIANYYDGVVLHPYGGAGTSSTLSAEGDRNAIVSAHAATGKPVWVTEVGWPTAVGQPSTGDSLQWTETQQAANIYNFVNWARSTGYVASVMVFNYRDYGTNTWYGVESSSGTKKSGWSALTEAADEQSCTVCG